MLRPLRTLLSDRLGQSSVEFALAVPLFLLLLSGMLDFGRAVACYSLVCNAARDGARAGIYEQTSDDVIRAAVNSETLFVGPIPAANISVAPAHAADRRSNSTIDVSVVYDYRPLISTLTGLGSGFRMSAISRMLIE